jgi:hypothetical protein
MEMGRGTREEEGDPNLISSVTPFSPTKTRNTSTMDEAKIWFEVST